MRIDRVLNSGILKKFKGRRRDLSNGVVVMGLVLGRDRSWCVRSASPNDQLNWRFSRIGTNRAAIDGCKHGRPEVLFALI